MSEPKDPERLLAEALRAQAVFAPQPERTPDTPLEVTAAASTSEPDKPEESATDDLPPQYGLISGAGADSLERERAALDAASAPAPEQSTSRQAIATPAPASVSLPAFWVLLLAVLLGLAAGSVVGLLTLL